MGQIKFSHISVSSTSCYISQLTFTLVLKLLPHRHRCASNMRKVRKTLQSSHHLFLHLFLFDSQGLVLSFIHILDWYHLPVGAFPHDPIHPASHFLSYLSFIFLRHWFSSSCLFESPPIFDSFSVFSFFFLTLTILRSIWYFIEFYFILLNFGLSIFILNWGYGFFGKYCRSGVPFSLHRIRVFLTLMWHHW